MMHKPYTEFLYAENDLYQTVTLPYGFSGIIGVLYCKIALHCIFAKFEGGEKWVNNR